MGARGVAVGLMNLVLASSCGGGGESANPSTPTPGAFGPFIDAFCQAARSCCGLSTFGNQQLADCEAEFERQTGIGALLAGGTVTVEPAALDACVAAHRRSATECVSSDELRTSCSARIFRGTVAEGGSCDGAIECWDSQSDWVCLKTLSSDVGVCRRAPHGRSGDACFRTCADDNPCLTTLTTSAADRAVGVCLMSDGVFCASDTCAPFLAEGTACSNDDACGPAHYCDAVCTPRKAENQACTAFFECAAPFTCVEGRCAITPIATQKLCSGDLN